jgi:hypothetical protein
MAPPAGAGVDRVTVHALLAFEASVVEVQCKVETTVGAFNVKLTLCAEPL